MTTYYIENTIQLEQLVLKQISKPLLEYLSKKVVDIMQKNLDDSDISTRTLQTCVDYNIDNSGRESIIEIDYELAQSFAEPPEYINGHMVEWGHLTTSIGPQAGSQFWNGQFISFQLAKWIEKGGAGNYGNQPIIASHWFSKTKDEVELNINKWANDYLKLNNII